MADLFLLYIMSIIAFALYGWDKHRAYFEKERIPEFVLLLVAFLGGAFGALCGMVIFHHKTQHKKFLVCVPLFVILQLAADIFYRIMIL